MELSPLGVSELDYDCEHLVVMRFAGFCMLTFVKSFIEILCYPHFLLTNSPGWFASCLLC